MSWGITIVECCECKSTFRQHGWLPFARQIWNSDEGLICCNQQTVIISQDADE